MKVFVTGASGFIGGHLVRRLLAEGTAEHAPQVFCLVRNPERFEWRGAERVTVLAGTLDDLPRYRQEVLDCVYVFHLAGRASLNAGGDYAHDNVAGTRNLLAALQGTTALRRLVFTSTIGAMDRRPEDPCSRPLVETTPPFPLSAYGRSKLECEQLVAQCGLPYAIVRPTWVYGPGMRRDSHIRVFVDMVRRGGLASRFAFPGQVSAIYVDDLVTSLLLAAHSERALGQVLLAADGEGVSIGALFRLIGELSGRPAGRMPIPAPAAWLAGRLRARLPLAAQNLFSSVLWADPAKLFDLGFKPQMPLREGLLRTIRWHNSEADRRAASPDRVTLVTGAAGGIGRALAELLYARGHDLLLVDRDASALESLARVLEARCLPLDLTGAGALDALAAYLEREGLCLHWVANNAGAGVRGPAVDLPFERQRQVIDLNCTAATFVARLAFQHFRRGGGGTLINVVSSAAFQPLPYMAVYAASKAYLLSFSRALSGEAVDLPGVRVLTASPSGTATNFQAAAGVKQNPGERLLSPAEVAAGILRAAERGRAEVTVGRSGQLMSLAGRALPAALQVRLWRRMMGTRR